MRKGGRMQKVTTMEQIDEALGKDATLLYVSAPNCNVCDALKPKVETLFTDRFPKVELYEANIAHLPELGGRFNIFSAPAILLFFEGKEFAREGRNISLELFAQKIQKVYDLYFS